MSVIDEQLNRISLATTKALCRIDPSFEKEVRDIIENWFTFENLIDAEKRKLREIAEYFAIDVPESW